MNTYNQHTYEQLISRNQRIAQVCFEEWIATGDNSWLELANDTYAVARGDMFLLLSFKEVLQ